MASFTTTPANWTNSSDANFRAWGSYISARLTAVGITVTADTGQINWTTVLTPSGVGVYAGYEIRQFTDTLQATAPVFIKIEYGEGAGADNPAIRMQFGSGSNGSGALTGTLSAQYVAIGTIQAGATITHGSGGPARFCINGGYTAGAVGMIFGFERSKDASGNDTSEAVLFIATGTTGSLSGSRIFGVWSTTLGDIGPTTAITAPALFPPGATGASGPQTIVVPILHSKGVFMNPGLNFAGYFTENITATSTPLVSAYGILHAYYAFTAASAWGSAQFQGAGGGTEALLMRYE